MPYTPPATRVTSPTLAPSLPPIMLKKKKDLDEISSNIVSNSIDNATKDRESVIQEVKDILSTSPQLSISPRHRKSAPELLLSLRKPSLKVDLPSPLSHEIPCIIRKKSGEVVKSSLKKSKSEPPTPTATTIVTTPTFPKYVHFNADLEQIRLFNEAQRPQAVSAEVSDDSDDDDDDEFDFLSDADDDDDDVTEEPELVVSLPNRPIITTMHSSKPVFVESIFLSRDKKVLQGRIMVQNIAFQKSVHVRYTFDFWSTVSEVSASYAEGVPSKDNKNSFDVFVFSIDLIDNSRNPIDGKTMYFAVHYRVEDNDFWDNNNGSNYQVNFKRIVTPSSPKKNSNSSISQNVPSRWSMASIPRRQTNESLCRSPPTCSPPTSIPINNTNDSRKRIFGRYDIGLSLSAAQNSQRSFDSFDYTRSFQSPYFPSQVSYCNDNYKSFFPNNCIDGMPGTSDMIMPPSSGFEPMKKDSNPISIPTRSAIGTTPYADFLNKYCFYSTSPPVLASS